MAFILTHTSRGGVEAGFSAMLRIWSGAFIHVIVTALGLSAMRAISVTAFSVVKWI
jgi:threonine/homoserine/homoserine lactone efflux protein